MLVLLRCLWMMLSRLFMPYDGGISYQLLQKIVRATSSWNTMHVMPCEVYKISNTYRVSKLPQYIYHGQIFDVDHNIENDDSRPPRRAQSILLFSCNYSWRDCIEHHFSILKIQGNYIQDLTQDVCLLFGAVLKLKPYRSLPWCYKRELVTRSEPKCHLSDIGN